MNMKLTVEFNDGKDIVYNNVSYVHCFFMKYGTMRFTNYSGDVVTIHNVKSFYIGQESTD